MKTILRMHPLPWDYRTDQLSEGYSTIIYDANGHCPILDHLREDEALDIVTAVNAREALVESLTEVMGWISNWDPNFIYDDEWSETRQRVEAALKLARAET